MDCLSPDNFSTLQMKGHVSHRARAHLRVPGCSLVWNALQTKKLQIKCCRFTVRVLSQKNMTGNNGFVLELVPLRGEKSFKPCSQNRIFVDRRGTSLQI